MKVNVSSRECVQANVAAGTVRATGQTIGGTEQACVVMQNGTWVAYNDVTLRPLGPRAQTPLAVRTTALTRCPYPAVPSPKLPYHEHVRVLEVQVHAAQAAAHVAREVALRHVRVQLVPAVEARVAVLAARVLLVQVRGQGGGVQRGLLQGEAQAGGQAHLAQRLVVRGPG